MPSLCNDSFAASIIRFCSEKVQHNLLTIHISSRVIVPSEIFLRIALPISVSFKYNDDVSKYLYPASIAHITDSSMVPYFS